MKYSLNLGALKSTLPARAAGGKEVFRLAVLGDFSGRASSGQLEVGGELAKRKGLAVDVDNLDELVGRLKVKLTLPIGAEGGAVQIPIASLAAPAETPGDANSADAELDPGLAAPWPIYRNFFMQTCFRLALCLAMLAAGSGRAMAEETAAEIFQRRILPLATAEKPSSCIECHVAGVDLRQYIRGDASSTFAALRAAGLVNAEQPEKSKLLEFISRTPEKGDAALAKVRAAELAAFGAWIAAAAKDPSARDAPIPSEPIGPSLPAEIIRHGRRDRVLQSFLENIWIERERCAGCHSPDKNQRLIEKHGEQISWIKPGDPAGTLATIIAHDLIDLDDPDRSLILQKPLAEVDHGGHIKFTRGSRTDKQFRKFLQDYAATAKGKYQNVAELPQKSEMVVVASAQHLRVIDLPEEFAGKFARIDLYRWSDGGFDTVPVAMMDGNIHPKNKLFQSVVFAVIPRTMDLAKEVEQRRQLPDGRYRAKLYVDKEKNAARNRDYEMAASDFVAEIEFDGPWAPGYQPPKILTFPAAVSTGQSP